MRDYARDRLITGSILASLFLHAAIAIVLVLAPATRRLEPMLERTIEVEILASPPPPTPTSEPQPQPQPSIAREAEPLPAPAQSAPPPATEATRPGPVPEAPLAMMRPTHMLSEKILADPRSRKARETLPKLESEERMVQLCSLEAMAQVEAWQKAFQPDSLVAYAMTDTKVAGDTLFADGAAFHSKHQWYNLKFQCDLTSDHKKVTAFAFHVGDAIPARDWESHDLPADGKHLD
ncbi:MULTISPECIES: DUF930 domain-containing protein [unclassified Beijerinckia]|uniref:DUF930 domain-containing protein n=1 Tax=unclassified Beijerinckia TaxID=2638183 RepID=UPI00089D44D7|nr:MULTISPECIES: DUF930 domain-containing protein [unclassified Beijerinckia]MDH7794088.1 hypothetical protein [Beijerinckia sp. GAS462]SEB53054.1 protein of unknown function [Beijerinckia sp. 28-YEA-48]